MQKYEIADDTKIPTSMTVELFLKVGDEIRCSENDDFAEFARLALAMLDGMIIVFTASDELPF